jgi:bacteriorhodopsin
MKKILYGMLGLVSAVFPTIALAASPTMVLESNDFVGISFWIISMALIAATVFFLLESFNVVGKWRTSLIVSGLVTLVASVHYFYMREVWILTANTPTVYRYIDWFITVPLLMIEFYLILRAVTKVPGGVFWRLITGTIVMLVSGYLGEAGYAPALPVFIIGMIGWGIILYEIFFGVASTISKSDIPPSVSRAFKLMRTIVTIGWAIYPIGYTVGYLIGLSPDHSMRAVNIIYNFADVLNKIVFGLIIWSVATEESQKNT